MPELVINGHTVQYEERLEWEGLAPSSYGLKFFPWMTNYSNYDDWAPFTKGYSREITPGNAEVVRKTVVDMYIDEDHVEDPAEYSILEIGVANNGSESFTHTLIDYKFADAYYFGVDVKDKTYLDNPVENVITIQSPSENRDLVNRVIRTVSFEHDKYIEFAVILIDGWHSLNTMINDWTYVMKLREGGKVIVHDTNSHPGPGMFVESGCVNPEYFKTERYFKDDEDFGITVFTKLKHFRE